MLDSGICLQAYIPMRKEPDEKSELISQILYGETFSLLESERKTNFSLVQSDYDSYAGYIDNRTLFMLTEADKELLFSGNQYITHDPITLLRSKSKSNFIFLGCGSTLYLTGSKILDLTKNEYYMEEKDINTEIKDLRKVLVEFGLKLVNIPYLWGGRSSFGFDCSGLCQNLYKQIGVALPRDSGPQSSTGRIISNIDDAKMGDLAFFDNENGQIVHAGIIISHNMILHSSGKVRIDRIDHQGIFSNEQNRYTHNLKIIRSILD